MFWFESPTFFNHFWSKKYLLEVISNAIISHTSISAFTMFWKRSGLLLLRSLQFLLLLNYVCNSDDILHFGDALVNFHVDLKLRFWEVVCGAGVQSTLEGGGWGSLSRSRKIDARSSPSMSIKSWTRDRQVHLPIWLRIVPLHKTLTVKIMMESRDNVLRSIDFGNFSWCVLL